MNERQKQLMRLAATKPADGDTEWRDSLDAWEWEKYRISATSCPELQPLRFSDEPIYI